MRSKMNMNDLKSRRGRAEEMQAITAQALARVRKTTGLNAKKSAWLVHNAWVWGKGDDQFKEAAQRKYIGRYARQRKGSRTELRVYDGYLFVFGDDENLITVHRLPKIFDNKQIYDGKKRVRNVKKYLRCHDQYLDGERGGETA